MSFVTKGDRIRARWFKPKPLGSYSIAGFQPKLVGDLIEVTGTVRHVRGDHPTHPTVVRFYIDPDQEGLPTMRPPGCTCDKEHVEVDPDSIIAILEKEQPPS